MESLFSDQAETNFSFLLAKVETVTNPNLFFFYYGHKCFFLFFNHHPTLPIFYSRLVYNRQYMSTTLPDHKNNSRKNNE